MNATRMAVRPALPALAATALLALTGCAHPAVPHHPRIRQVVLTGPAAHVPAGPGPLYLHCDKTGHQCHLSHQPLSRDLTSGLPRPFRH